VVGRGDIWLVTLDSTAGSETKKARPCPVVSPAEMHNHLRTVIVAPMSTESHPAPFRISVTHAGRKGLVLLDQVRALDKARLVKRLGAVPPRVLVPTLATLREVFAD